MDGNQFVGPIPGELSQLNALVTLDLEDNNLSGPVPTSFTTFNPSANFMLSGNNLNRTLTNDADIQGALLTWYNALAGNKSIANQ